MSVVILLPAAVLIAGAGYDHREAAIGIGVRGAHDPPPVNELRLFAFSVRSEPDDLFFAVPLVRSSVRADVRLLRPSANIPEPSTWRCLSRFPSEVRTSLCLIRRGPGCCSRIRGQGRKLTLRHRPLRAFGRVAYGGGGEGGLHASTRCCAAPEVCSAFASIGLVAAGGRGRSGRRDAGGRGRSGRSGSALVGDTESQSAWPS